MRLDRYNPLLPLLVVLLSHIVPNIVLNIVLQKIRVKMTELRTLRAAHGWTLIQRCLAYPFVGM